MFMKMLSIAKKLVFNGADISHMEVGEPDFTMPQRIVNVGFHALQWGG